MSPSPRSSSVDPEELVQLPDELQQLSLRVDERPDSFAVGDEDIRLAALKATKYVFDLALQTESKSRAQINELLASLAPSQAPQTRAQAKAQKANGAPKQPDALQLQDTPIPELTVDGMDADQIWAQLELRAASLADVLEAALEGTGEVPESEDESEAGSMARKMRGIGVEGEDEMDVDMEDMDFDDEEDSEDMSDEEYDEDDDSEDEDGEDEEEEDEDDGEEEDYGEGVVELRDPSDGEGDVELDAPSAKGRKARTKGKGKGHPELDDGFFDLAAFNRETEEAEARATSKGRLSRDDSDDEDAELGDVDLFAPVDDVEQAEDEEPFYNDFFAPPAKGAAKGKSPAAPKANGNAKKAGVRFHNEVRVKNIKAKGKNLSLSQLYSMGEDDEDDEEEAPVGGDDSEEDEDDEDDEEEGAFGESYEEDSDEGEEFDEDEDVEMASQSEDEEDATRETIERLKDDLFADDEEEEDKSMTTHEKRMASIREEIAALESENVAQKHWTLLGEATTRSRPQNALLEEDLEFERVMKSVPVITEETVQGLEERIKQRIAAGQFDDVVRRRPVDDKPFLPGRFFELQDTKSKQSLAEIYEDEYTAAKTGGVAGEDRDGKLKKEHDEIEKQWEQISSKLDALCNAHFTPKAPKATISTVANISAATMESALPTTQAATTMLAPEEVFAPQEAQLKAKSELTPEEKRALRNKHKKANKKTRATLEQTAQLHKKAKGAGEAKQQKDAALKSLVKSGKGVTVIGKKSKEHSSKAKS